MSLAARLALLLALLTACAAGAWKAYTMGHAAGAAEVQSQLETLRHAVEMANTEAANKSAALQRKVTEAQNAARIRERDLEALAAGAGAESDGLRNDLARLRDQYAGATDSARAERAAAVAHVLGECSRAYSDLAKKADRHVNDIRTLIEASPK